MSADDPVAIAISEWQRRHRIADDDPILAVLELVRLQLQHARTERNDTEPAPPSFEDFRDTIELLDRRSKSLIGQASDLIAELRRFGQKVERLNRVRFVSVFVLGAAAGVLVSHWL